MAATVNPECSAWPCIRMGLHSQGFVVWCAGSSGMAKNTSAYLTGMTELVNEEILLTLDAGGIHNGSRLLVLPDNTLLMTAGDAAPPPFLNRSIRCRNPSRFGRFHPDDNPYPDSYIYTFGNRNSQGLALNQMASSTPPARTNSTMNSSSRQVAITGGPKLRATATPQLSRVFVRRTTWLNPSKRGHRASLKRN